MADQETTPTSETSDTLLTDVTNSEGNTSETTAGDNGGTTETTTNGDSDTTADPEGDTSIPETYADFTLPEGIPLDDKLMEKALPLFKELKLTQEQAQKLVDLKAEEIQASVQSQVDTFNQLKQDWHTASKNDKEIGGDKFDESIATGRIALQKFGTPELTKLLNDTGIGNNPEVIRFMTRVGKLMQEDSPGTTGGSVADKKDRVSILYPTSNGS